jgi:hypothetical protein
MDFPLLLYHRELLEQLELLLPVLLPHPLLEQLLEPKRRPRLALARRQGRSPGRWLRSPRTAQRPVQRTNGYS